ncbi:MAG: hypothetical protein EON98_05505 [Chitinophagaceae bacterium]|nr:MAG: hypothetical protein EON98_05505 [Chitinophagaceae bacterium]
MRCRYSRPLPAPRNLSALTGMCTTMASEIILKRHEGIILRWEFARYLAVLLVRTIPPVFAQHQASKNGAPCPYNSSCICTAPSIKKDSVVFGSSYWVDRVYISTDSMGLNTATARLLNETKHGTQYSGIYLPVETCPANYSNKLDVDNVISPNADFPKSLNVNLPSDLEPGNYFIYVQTNAAKDVFEYPGTPQIKRSAIAITVSRPDVVVSSIASPTSSTGGKTISIDYAVTNNGPGTVFSHLRKDQLYISNFSAFDASAMLLSTQSFTESLPVGSAVPHSFTYKLPAAATGAKYFYVVANFDSTFRETSSANNRSTAAVTLVSAAVPSDLMVSAIQLPDTIFTNNNTAISYTVTNSGTGTTVGTWTDSLFVSCNAVFSPSTAYFVARKSQTKSVGTNNSYTDTFSFVIPKMSWELSDCFPKTATATAHFFLKTNADSGAYEAFNTANNVMAATKIIANPLVDHTITAVSTSADTVLVGRPLGVQWTVKNIGYRPPSLYYHWYYDGVFFSVDSVWNPSDPVAASYLKYTLLNRNDSLNEAKQITTPNLPTGDYYLFAKTNYTNIIDAETVLGNNTALLRNSNGAAKKIHIIQPLLPDLVDSILSAPSTVVAGQPITVVRRTINKGVGVTYPLAWQNNLLLSANFALENNSGDRLLSQKTKNGALQPGEFRDDTVTVTIPIQTVPGSYVLVSEADANSKMAETNELNNLAFHLLTVFEPPVVDLLVETVNHPDTVYLGDAINTVKWWLRNASPNEAKGWLTDGIYLSANGRFDSTAILLGVDRRIIDLAPLKTDSGRMTPLLTGVTEGVYNLYVKTDLLNNFVETDKENNSSLPLKQLFVKVRELPFNQSLAATLPQTSAYYKLQIPDSLAGSTIMVTLKTPDSLTVRNEIYIGGGYVPTPAKYDYKYEIPNYGNQQIVMTTVTQQTYYIQVRSVSPNPPLQAIMLQAVKLPFAVLNVLSPSGGNTGNVTVKIRGSLFTEGMTAVLQNAGNAIIASQVYFTNSTQVFATFNLKGKPLGLYDVVLKKGDTANAVLASSFSIVPTNNGGLITGSGPNTGSGNGSEPGCDPGAASGLNSQLVVELVVPPIVLLKRPIEIFLNYHNPTNVDIPAQTRTLYSDGLKMALSKAGVATTGTTSLYLELTELDGPPGVIRAGGSGTIIIHSVAPHNMPADPVVLFKLK